MLRYNIGCGTNRLEGFVNVDINPGDNVDQVCDIRYGLINLPHNEADEIVCFHTIEHIERVNLCKVFYSFAKLLKMGGKLIVSFPDFAVSSKFFLDNKRGQRDFWEATIFGRKAFAHDEHLCALVPSDVVGWMTENGFEVTKIAHEPVPNECNAIIYARKVFDPVTYGDTLKEI